MISATASRYLMVGMCNTLVGLSVIYLCKWLLRLDDVSANMTGYAIGITVSFVLNRQWTFRHDGPVFRAAIKFVFVLAVAYFANLAAVLFSINVLAINSYIAQAIGIVPYVVIGYLGCRYIAFK